MQVIRRKQQAASRPQAAPRCAEGALNGQRQALLAGSLALRSGICFCSVLCCPFRALLKKGARRCLPTVATKADYTLFFSFCQSPRELLLSTSLRARKELICPTRSSACGRFCAVRRPSACTDYAAEDGRRQAGGEIFAARSFAFLFWVFNGLFIFLFPVLIPFCPQL